MTRFQPREEMTRLLPSKQLPESLQPQLAPGLLWSLVDRPQRAGQCEEAKDAWKKGRLGYNIQEGQYFGNRPGETKASIFSRGLSGTLLLKHPACHIPLVFPAIPAREVLTQGTRRL